MKRSTIFAFIGGSIAGATVALLTTPKKGEDMRKEIKNFADKKTSELKKNMKKMSEKKQHASSMS